MTKGVLVKLLIIGLLFSFLFVLPGCNVNDNSNPDEMQKVMISPSGTKSIGTGGVYNWYTGPFYDDSGRVETVIFENSVYGQHNTVSVTVPEEFVMIGGGAQIDYYGGKGALLTGSWPSYNRRVLKTPFSYFPNGVFRTQLLNS